MRGKRAPESFNADGLFLGTWLRASSQKAVGLVQESLVGNAFRRGAAGRADAQKKAQC